MVYIAPRPLVSSFTCAFCGVIAQQSWSDSIYVRPYSWAEPEVSRLARCTCTHCKSESFWHLEEAVQIYPTVSAAPMPHQDMPDECLADFHEARAVFGQSPRAAAALLRLCVEKLLATLAGKDQKIDLNIAALVARGVPRPIIDALDICRVFGNNAVHPGQIDLQEDPSLVGNLFELINFIVRETIEREKSLALMMSRIPSSVIEGIERRDRKVISAAALPDSQSSS